MAVEEERKRRRRREKKNSPAWPSKIVCTANDLKHEKNGMELGILLSFIVIGLYLYGFVESIQSLPDVSDGRRLGANMNVARMETDQVLLPIPSHENDSPVGITSDAAPAGRSSIPAGKWPVSTRDEESDFEVLIHAGDMKTELLVPKFFSPPLHNEQFFSREQAMQVGTCITPDPKTGSHVRGTDCPSDDRTIFVAIASYRDYQCRYTVESIFNRAQNPHRVRIGE